jgi:DNA-directed RNA polymerase specialized sigma24 family protein
MPESASFRSADADAIAHAYREHGYSMREIASHLGCGLTTVHRRICSQERLRVDGTDA